MNETPSLTPNPDDFENCESLYWVFTQRCNDRCAHCYNSSGPRGEKISLEDCLAIVDNLPAKIDRLILSGGEPLVERAKLHAILEAARARFGTRTQLMVQTNGDMLDEERLDELLERGVSRVDIASMDRLHAKQGSHRERLTELFLSRGMVGDSTDPLVTKDTYLKPGTPSFGFWGATEELWLGGNWPRGRALETGLWKRDGDHNFCAILSGGKGFLGGTDLPREVSIQLWQINPCCPGTKRPLGDARREKVADVLARVARSPVFQVLNQGNPYGMGASLGIDEARGRERARELGSVCLWCDEFFDRHYDMETLEPREPGEE